MDSNITKKDKKKIIVVAIFIMVITLIGGTLAYIVFKMNFTNHTYTDYAECFDIDYSILNDDDTSSIAGTLFPSVDYSGGLYGKVSLNINEKCNITGLGEINLHVDTKYRLVGYAAPHCENPDTLETITDYTEQTACESAGYTWVVGGSALKYAVVSNEGIESVGKIVYDDYIYLDDNTILGDADSDGDVDADDAQLAFDSFLEDNYDLIDIDASDMNRDGELSATDATIIYAYANKLGTLNIDYDVSFDTTVYSNFMVDNTKRDYTIYIWMDGELIDNSHASIPFGGEISAKVVQREYPSSAIAIYSASDNSLRFYDPTVSVKEGSTFNGRVATAVYTEVGNVEWDTLEEVPWYEYSESITKVAVEHEISPIYTVRWMANLKNCNTYDLEKLNTSKVINMKYMFYLAGYNLSTFTLDLSNFDTSNVSDMTSMFWGTGYSATSYEIEGLDNFDTSNVKYTSAMFANAGYSATDWSIGDLSKKDVTDSEQTYVAWDTSNVKYMNSMFEKAGYNTSTFNVGNLTNWDVSNVEGMKYMFYCAGKNATSWTIGTLDNWNVSKVKTMFSMFEGAGYNASSTFTIGNLNNWNVSKVTNMSSMFSNAGYSATSWNIGELNNWDVSNVENMSYMFLKAGYSATNSFTIGDLDNWNVSKVTNMHSMFEKAGYSATDWSIGDLSKKDVTDSEQTYVAWDTSNVTNMKYMFYYAGYSCTGWSMNLSNWNVFKVSEYTDFNSGISIRLTAPTFVTTSS